MWPWVRRVLTVTIIVEAGLLALFAFLLADTLDPDFRGGWFVTATLVLGLAFLAPVFARDIAAAVRGRPPQPAGAADRGAFGGEDEGPQAITWGTIGEAALTLTGVFSAIFVLGVLLGTALAAWVILIWQSQLNFGKALIGAVLIGIMLPVAFALALDLTLWPGAIPQLIPDWVGGGLIPPL
jgi:hypothetical protein